MKNILRLNILFALLFFSFHALAQPNEVDSLQNLLRLAKDDTTRINLYLKLAWLPGLETEVSQSYSDSAVELAKNVTNKNFIARAYKSKGDKYLTYNYDSCLYYYQLVVENYILAGNEKDLSSAYYSVGNCYLGGDRLTESMDAFVTGEKIAQKAGYARGLAYNKNGIATINFHMKNYEEAERYHREALEVSFEVGEPKLTAWIYTGLGNLFITRQNYDSALVCFNGALEQYTLSAHQLGMAGAHNNIGIVYMFKEEYPKAIEHYRIAAAAKHENNDLVGESIALGNIAQMYAMQGSSDSAIYYARLSVEIADRGNSLLQKASAFSSLAEAFAIDHQYDSALKYEKLFKKFNDSVYTTDLHEQLTEMQARYENEQQKQQIALLEKNNEIGQLWNYFFAAAGGLVLVIALFTFARYRQKKKANILLEQQNMQISEQKREITDSILYARKIQRALLASQSLIAKNVHDHFVFYKPKDIVSGDFYWATSANNSFWIAACDSTGHGVPGAFMSLLNTTFLAEAINEKKLQKPGEVFDFARRKLIDSLSAEGDDVASSDGMDGTLLRIEGHTIYYSGANNAPLLVRGGVPTELHADKMPVGRSPRQEESFTTYEFTVQRGDLVYLFTDGFADQFGGGKGKKFKHKNLIDLLAINSSRTTTEQKEILQATLHKWQGNLEQLDDILVIGLKF